MGGEKTAFARAKERITKKEAETAKTNEEEQRKEAKKADEDEIQAQNNKAAKEKEAKEMKDKLSRASSNPLQTQYVTEYKIQYVIKEQEVEKAQKMVEEKKKVAMETKQ